MASTAAKLAAEPATASADLVLSAQVEFYACLQLLAERARFLTGASWAAIAIREQGRFIYRSAAGENAPEVGSEAQVKPEAIASSQGEFRPWNGLCIGIIRDSEKEGFIQLASDKLEFSDQDYTPVLRLSVMVSTALDHMRAAERSHELISSAPEGIGSPPQGLPTAAIPLLWHAPEGSPMPSPANSAASGREVSLHVCSSCGFPVSGGRSICVDCESRGINAPQSLLLTEQKSESWLSRNGYTIASLLVRRPRQRFFTGCGDV